MNQTQPADVVNPSQPALPAPPETAAKKEKKSWKAYLFEFLLVFTAVLLGFMADSFRENLEDRQKEKKYMRSLIADISGDYGLSKGIAASVSSQVLQIDTLEQLLNSATILFDEKAATRCYTLSGALMTFYSEFFHERTINQLLSSGSMRLIGDQDVADSIMAYYAYTKFLDDQRQLYITSVTSCNQAKYEVFDINWLRTKVTEDGVPVYMFDDETAKKLKSTGQNDLQRFTVQLENCKLVANNYASLLTGMADKAERLYTYLSGIYH